MAGKEVVLRFVGNAGHLNRTFQEVDANAGRTMSSLQSKVAGATAVMTSKFSAAGASLAAVGASAKQTGAKMTRNLSLPMAALGAVGIKTAMDYEKSMNILQAASKAGPSDMAAMGKLAKDLGADLTLPGTSASDAALAMVELAKAGLNVSEIMGATKGVLQLSAAGGLDNATSATVAANALNAFGLKGTEAVRIADLLAAAANGSSAEVSELADSLSQGASVFAQAGIPIEDFVTSAALLANVGIKGSDAGTSLKSMMLKLQAPSEQAAGMMRELGISLYDAQGRMKPFASIIGSFSKAMGGLTQEQRDMSLGKIFGSDAIRSANAVLLAGIPAFTEMKKITTEQGAAAKTAAAKNKGLAGAMDAIKSSLETLAVDVIVPLLPKMESMARAVAGFIGRLTSLPKPVLIAAAAFAGILVAIGPLTFVFGALAGAVGFLLSPLGLVAAGLVAVGLAVAAALNPEKAGAAVDGFAAKWAELWPKVQPKLAAFAAGVWEWLQVNVPIIVAQLAKWTQAFVEWVLPIIPPLLTKLGHVLGAIGTWITGTAVPALAQKLRDDWIPAFVGWVADITPPLLVELGKMLIELTKWIAMDALPAIQAALAKMAISIPVGIAKGAAGAAVDLVTGQAGGGKGKSGKSGAQKALDFVTGPIGGMLGFANGGALLGVNRPTPVLIGEGHGKEDMLAVPHSKGGLAGLGGNTFQSNFYGVPLEEAMERTKREQAWRMALVGRR